MADSSSRKVIYEAQRQARMGEPPVEKSSWKRRLWFGGSGCFFLVGGVVWFFVWNAMTYVTVSQARVHAAVTVLASEVDARACEVCLQPGQPVKKGQAILRLDDSEFRIALESGQAGQALAQTRIEAVRKSLELRQAAVPEEIRRAGAECCAEKARLAQLRNGARPEDIETAKLRVENARAQVEMLASDLEWTGRLVQSGYEAPRALEVQKLQLATQRNAVRTAELALTQLIAGPTPEQIQAAEQAVAAREAGLALAKTGEKEIEALRSDLAGREAELQQAQADVAKCRGAIARCVIVSPVDGTLLRTFAREGELCRRGTPAAMVSDDTKGRWVEGTVREFDAARLKIGQSARVEIVTGSGQYFPATLDAVGASTSSIGRSDAESAASAGRPAGPETVWVCLKPSGEVGNPLPGMTATATIRVR